MLLAAVRHGGHSFSLPGSGQAAALPDGGRCGRLEFIGGPGTRRAACPLACDPEASYSQIPLDGHTKSRRRDRSVTRGDDPELGTCAPSRTRHHILARSDENPPPASPHPAGARQGSSANSRRRASGTPARSRLMRGGSPAAETDHAWAATAPISPLCKDVGPSMINSTGEPNGGSSAPPHGKLVTGCEMRRPGSAGLGWVGPRLRLMPGRTAKGAVCGIAVTKLTGEVG